jgi:hypothetical protein
VINSGSEDYLYLAVLLGKKSKNDPAARAVLAMLSEMDRGGRFSREEAIKALDQMIGATHGVESEMAIYQNWGIEAAKMDKNNRPLWFVVNSFSRIRNLRSQYLSDLMKRIRQTAEEAKANLAGRA